MEDDRTFWITCKFQISQKSHLKSYLHNTLQNYDVKCVLHTVNISMCNNISVHKLRTSFELFVTNILVYGTKVDYLQ